MSEAITSADILAAALRRAERFAATYHHGPEGDGELRVTYQLAGVRETAVIPCPPERAAQVRETLGLGHPPHTP